MEAKTQKFKILPARPGTCCMCAVDHPPELPHDLTSVFYGVRFKMKWGRDPTWADAAAHCSAEVIANWKQGMRSTDAEWTEPVDGEPIREPYAESDP